MPLLTGNVTTAPTGAHGFDTDEKLNSTSARRMRPAVS